MTQIDETKEGEKAFFMVSRGKKTSVRLNVRVDRYENSGCSATKVAQEEDTELCIGSKEGGGPFRLAG